MSDNPIQVPIQYAVDTSKATPNLDALISRIRQSRNELDTLATKAKADPFGVIGKSARTTSAEVTRLRSILESVDTDSVIAKTTKNLTESIKGLRSEITKTEAAIDNLNATPVGRSASLTAGSVAQFEQPLKGLSGSIGAFGGSSNVGSALNIGAEVAASIDAIGQLTENLSSLKTSGAGAALAMGGVGLAAAGLSFIAKESNAELAKFITAQEAAIERQRRLKQELEGLANEDDISRLRDANEERRLQIEAEIDAIERERDASDNARIRDAAEQLSPLVNLIATGGASASSEVDVLGKALDTFGVNTDDTDAKLAALNEELSTLDASSEQLAGSLALVSVQARSAVTELDNQLNRYLVRIRLQADGTTEELDKLIESTRQTILANEFLLVDATGELYKALLGQAQASLSPEQLAEVDLSQGILTSIENIKTALDQAGVALAPGVQDLDNKFTQIDNTIVKLTDDLNNSLDPAIRDNIQAREAETAELEANKKALEETTKAEEKRRDSLAKATGDYQDAVTSLEQFQRSIAEKTAERQRDAQRDSIRDDLRRQIDAAKAVEAEQERLSKLNQARVKANQDIQATERKLQAENVKAAAEYAKQRQQAERDLADSLQEAALDNDVNAFLSAKKAGEKELNRLDDEYQTQKRERETQARETTNNILRQLQEQERAELTQRANTITRSLQLEQQLARLEEQWRVQDAQRRLQLEQQASNDRLRLLQNEVIQARNIIRLLQSPVQRQTAVNQATNAIANAFQGVGNAFSFADGGIATRPTLAIVGDKPGYAEAMIPFRPSEGIGRAAARAGLGNVTLNLTQIIGEVASPKDIESARTEVFNAILEAKRLEYAEVV